MSAPASKRILIPEPGSDIGHPCVKITFDWPGGFVSVTGDPEEPSTGAADTRDIQWVVNRIAAWQVDDGLGKAPRWLSFTDPTFGLEYFVSAKALRAVTSVERQFVTVMTPELVRKMQRARAGDGYRELDIAVPRIG